MDRTELIAAKAPRHRPDRRTLDIAEVAARFGARVREQAAALTPAALGRRAERLERLRMARRRD
jgi:hypothetical protein